MNSIWMDGWMMMMCACVRVSIHTIDRLTRMKQSINESINCIHQRRHAINKNSGAAEAQFTRALLVLTIPPPACGSHYKIQHTTNKKERLRSNEHANMRTYVRTVIINPFGHATHGMLNRIINNRVLLLPLLEFSAKGVHFL